MSVGALFLQIRQLHENQRLIQLGATPGGRILVWLLATLLLPEPEVFYVAPLLFLLLWLPDGGGGGVEIGRVRIPVRNVVLCLGSVAYLVKELAYCGISESVFVAADVAILVGICLLVYRAACSFDSWPTVLRKRPQLVLHGILLGILALAFSFAESPAIIGSALWQNANIIFYFLIFLVWRFGYLLLAAKRGKIRQSCFADHLFYFLPV